MFSADKRWKKLYEIEAYIDKMNLNDVADDVAELDDEYQLVISGWYIFIPEIQVRLYSGILCIRDKTTGIYMPDCDVAVICEEGQDMQKIIIYEQENMVNALADWLCGSLSVSALEQMWCEVICN